MVGLTVHLNNETISGLTVKDIGSKLKIGDEAVFETTFKKGVNNGKTAKEAFELVGHNRSGWVVPFKDLEGKHYLTRKGKPFYRLKPDEGEIKYLSPSEEGCRPYFSPLLELKHFASGRDIFITEGEKKSDCLVAHGFPTIGLSGVWCWKDHRSGESKMLIKNRHKSLCY